MTLPRANILVNNSTGSDTAASGLGPGTAVSGTAAAHTNGSASTTITLTNTPDLSGVVAGDLLWLNTGSGRQYSVISVVDNGADTVTVDDSFNIAAGSPVDYAIGGKRATLDHADTRTLFADWKDTWAVGVEETGTNYTLASTAISISGSGYRKILGIGATPPNIVQQANTYIWDVQSGGSSAVLWENLKLYNTNGTKTSAYAVRFSDGYAMHFHRCIFGHDTAGSELLSVLLKNGGETRTARFSNCAIINTTGGGTTNGNANIHIQMFECLVRDCDNHGVWVGDAGSDMILENTAIENCAGDGVRWLPTSNNVGVITGCTIHGNTGDGIEINTTGGVLARFANNNITANGGYGIRAPSGFAPSVFVNRHNNYGTGATANTSGARLNVDAGTGDLAVDPQYVDAANSNFEVGANVKAQGYPPSSETIGANVSATNTFIDIGASQREEVSGSVYVSQRRSSSLIGR